MADIDINAGLAIKADLNGLYCDVAGSLTKFKEDRRFNKQAYEELLGRCAETVSEVEKIRNQLNSLIEDAQSNKLPDENEVKAIDAIAGLMGAKNNDGSLDFKKLMELDSIFKSNSASEDS